MPQRATIRGGPSRAAYSRGRGGEDESGSSPSRIVEAINVADSCEARAARPSSVHADVERPKHDDDVVMSVRLVAYGADRRMGALRITLVTAIVAVVLSHVQPARADLLRAVFGKRTPQARCIRTHESHGEPRLISPTADYGWFQINYPTWHGKIVSFYERGRGVWIRLPHTLDTFKRRTFRPLYNARVAWAISKGGTDWSPWVSYSRHGFCREGS